jgi:phospholipase C
MSSANNIFRVTLSHTFDSAARSDRCEAGRATRQIQATVGTHRQGDFMISKNLRWMAAMLLAANLATVGPYPAFADGRGKGNKDKGGNSKGGITTNTPIKHVVVIFQENISFDHYFGTYPDADNPVGEVQFRAKANTPSVNGLTEGLLEHNLNQDKTANFYQPVRLGPSQNYTCDQNHDYTPEQQAFDSGLMDKFPEFTATPCSAATFSDVSNLGAGIVMGYYDGNTVTGLWNYAQHFVLNDNSFGTIFGPSTPGALNVISGMTGGADPNANKGATAAGDVVDNAVIGDPDPYYDDCSGSETVGMLSTNKNIGDLLSAKGVSWAWFQGGFTPTTPATATAPAQCKATTNRIDGTPEAAYSPHHNPFQYYKSTSNPHHLPPSSLNEVGHDGQANHQYDLSLFQQAVLAKGLPAVTYLKANRAQDGHPSNSSPLDEQAFLVNTLNFLQRLPDWEETAVIIAWDDSDGWYDHVMPPIVNQSASTADGLTGPGACGSGTGALAAQQARCGYGPRLPLLIVSPYAKKNFVDHSLTDQSSVVRFIEENWELPEIGNGSYDVLAGTILNAFDFKNQRMDKVILDPSTGQVIGDN